MAKVKKKTRKKSSFFMGVLDAFTAFVCSVFANGRFGTWLSSGDGNIKDSFFINLFEKVSRAYRRSELSDAVDLVMKKSKFAKATDSIRGLLSNMSLGVYGLFFAVYGTVSAFVYFIPILIRGENTQGESALVTAIITAVCAIPLAVSNRSLVQNVSDSKVLKGIVLSFFAIPEEKLNDKKKAGGAILMVLSALLGLSFGGLTYFVHPAYIFALLAVIVVMCLISANPESGVALTLVLVPFLQYTPFPVVILVALIFVTVFSYISKVVKRRRVMLFSLEGVCACIFCGFILLSGFFSKGGAQTAWDSLAASVIILGAFFTTYNLMRGQKLLGSCIKIIAVSFSILAALGVFNVFYDGIVDGVTYSIRDYVQPIFEGNNLYIADNASVFSVLAILSFPMIFSFMSKQKTVKNIMWLLVLSAVLMGACFIYGTYETVLAVAIEFCIFWLIYSHKTLNVAVMLLVPIGFLVIFFPYAAIYFDLPNLVDAVTQYLPISSPDSSYYVGISNSTFKMLAELKSGIGAGDHAFITSIAPYLDASSRGATTPGSFWLQILCWSGIGGFVTFLVFIGSVLKNSLGFLAVSRDNKIRSEALALACGLITAMVFGGVNCLWNDLRMLYLFWAMAGLLAGYVREGKELSYKHDAELAHEIDGSDVELIFHK